MREAGYGWHYYIPTLHHYRVTIISGITHIHSNNVLRNGYRGPSWSNNRHRGRCASLGRVVKALMLMS